jgi:hypothetical protein
MSTIAHETAERAEGRWAAIVGVIIFLLVAMMVFTGLHWAAMPPSRVETIDPRTLHMRGEFVRTTSAPWWTSAARSRCASSRSSTPSRRNAWWCRPACR